MTELLTSKLTHMKKLISLMMFMALVFAVPSAQGNAGLETAKAASESVYICTGPSATKYHSKHNCRGLRKCSCEIKKVSVASARKSQIYCNGQRGWTPA